MASGHPLPLQGWDWGEISKPLALGAKSKGAPTGLGIESNTAFDLHYIPN